MKKIYFILMLCLFGVLVNSCKKEDEKKPIELSEEALTSTQADFWYNQETVDMSLFDIILPNGMYMSDFLYQMDPNFYFLWGGYKSSYSNANLGPQDAKNLLIAKLNLISWYLTNRNNFQYPEENSKRPAQNGLAYVWNSKDHSVRYNPSNAGSKCDQELFGLDCSGLVYQLFKNSGVIIPVGRARDQIIPATIEKAIKKAYPEMSKIVVEDLGKISPDLFESGDIIYWKNSDGVPFHIGMVVLKWDGTLAIVQSNGGPDDCARNITIKCGPRFVNSEKAVLPTNQYGFGDNYGIVRINAKISGSWTFKLRCENQSYDLLSIDLNFPVDTDNDFFISKTAIDYDGSAIKLDFYFSYSKVSNILSCSYICIDYDIPGFERKDHFSVKLERDDTDYITAINDYIINGTGCTNQVRLINNEKMSVKNDLLFGMQDFLNFSTLKKK